MMQKKLEHRHFYAVELSDDGSFSLLPFHRKTDLRKWVSGNRSLRQEVSTHNVMTMFGGAFVRKVKSMPHPHSESVPYDEAEVNRRQTLKSKSVKQVIVDEPVPDNRKPFGYLGGNAHKSLEQALLIFDRAFGEKTYLVGSALETPDHNDVDLRMIMDDGPFGLLFGKERYMDHSAFWSLLMVALSEYLEKRTGLTIDFQIQKRSKVKEEDWAKWRQPMAVFYDSVRNKDLPPVWHRGMMP